MCTVASCLIALDKCPGVRPIQIGETLCRVVGKTICLATHINVTMVCSSDQLYAGLSSGIEEAIHAMNSLYLDHQGSNSGWGVLMVDAANAFNLLNHTVMLLHAWPCCARFLLKAYRVA